MVWFNSLGSTNWFIVEENFFLFMIAVTPVISLKINKFDTTRTTFSVSIFPQNQPNFMCMQTRQTSSQFTNPSPWGRVGDAHHILQRTAEHSAHSLAVISTENVRASELSLIFAISHTLFNLARVVWTYGTENMCASVCFPPTGEDGKVPSWHLLVSVPCSTCHRRPLTLWESSPGWGRHF